MWAGGLSVHAWEVLDGQQLQVRFKSRIWFTYYLARLSTENGIFLTLRISVEVARFACAKRALRVIKNGVKTNVYYGIFLIDAMGIVMCGFNIKLGAAI